jgi:uncharacterized C2H2 Zn-finger protein
MDSLSELYKKKSPTQFECNVCGIIIKYKGNIVRHAKKHDDRYRFRCSICSRFFMTASEFSLHQEKKHSVAQKCVVCSKTFLNKSNFMQHMMVHLSKRQIVSHNAEWKSPLDSHRGLAKTGNSVTFTFATLWAPVEVHLKREKIQVKERGYNTS